MTGLKVEITKVFENFYELKLIDDETKLFEAMWEIPEGVTYNAYLLIDEKVVLFDGWKKGYGEKLIKAISEIIDPSKIDIAVVHHMEPDHSGGLAAVVRESGAVVVGHPLVKGLMKEYYDLEPEFIPVKDGEEIKVGKNTLKFIHTPWLHWPETIMTYIPERKILLTCDAFGSFGTTASLWHSKKYFASVVGKYKDFVVRAYEKLKDLDVEYVLPAHGTRWGKWIIEEWVRWAKGVDENKAVVIFGSMYGFSHEIAQIVIDELEEAGVKVEAFGFTDKGHARKAEILAEAVDARYVVVIAPTYEGGAFWPVEEALRILAEKLKYSRKAVVINTCGWGCNPRAYKEILERGRYNVVDVVTIKGRMNEDAEERVREAIRKLLST